ncbi:MAG: RIP metalloprotease RseP [bacterium]
MNFSFSPSPRQRRLFTFALVFAAVVAIASAFVFGEKIAVLKGLLALWTFLVAFGLFSITVFVHEWGHFLAARRYGLVVERFAIGFGPKILGWERNGVEYVLNLFPLGGFVQLPQIAAMDIVEGKSQTAITDLPPASPWAKGMTAFWGPLFSFLLACVLAVLVYFLGIPQNQALNTTTIGYIEPDSPAAKAGLQPGDRIVSIDGKKVERWAGRSGGVAESIVLSIGKKVQVEVERSNQLLKFDIIPEKDPTMEGLRSLGFEKYFARELVVDMVIKNSPAHQAGLEKGDRVLSFNDQPIFSSIQLSKQILVSQGPQKFTYIRDGARHDVFITPQKAVNHHMLMIGVIWKPDESQLVNVDPWSMISASVTFIYKTLRALVSHDSGVGFKHLSGPVGIFDKIMELLSIDWRLVLYFGVILNVNLAIINLMPLPVLDGGHIVLCLIEAIRKRPLPPKVIYAIQTSFFFALISLILFVSFYDVRRIKNRVTQPEEKPLEMPRFEETKEKPVAP